MILIIPQKDDLQREIVRLGESLKDASAKNKTLKDENEEQQKLFTNNQVLAHSRVRSSAAMQSSLFRGVQPFPLVRPRHHE